MYDQSIELATTMRALAIAVSIVGVQFGAAVFADDYWNWRRLRRIDRSDDVRALHRQLLEIFETDPLITVVKCCDEFPLW